MFPCPWHSRCPRFAGILLFMHPHPYFAPLTKPRQPLCGRISGLAGTSSLFFSIAKPLRGCLRGRSGRARGPQATGGRGAARPTPRSRPRRRAGSLWEYGSPPVGARLKVCQHRPRAKFSPKMAAQLQVKHYREKLQDLGGSDFPNEGGADFPTKWGFGGGLIARG